MNDLIKKLRQISLDEVYELNEDKAIELDELLDEIESEAATIKGELSDKEEDISGLRSAVTILQEELEEAITDKDTWVGENIDQEAKYNLFRGYRDRFTWAELNHIFKQGLEQKKSNNLKEDFHENAEIYSFDN